MKMKTDLFRILTTLIVLISHFGCATIASVDRIPTNDVERKTIAQASAAYSTGGALLVGGLAFGVAKMQGYDDETAFKVAIAAAIAAGYVGYEYGIERGKFAVRQKRYVTLEKNRLNMLIADARSYNSGLRNYNSRLRARIATLEAERSPDRGVKRAVARRASAERNSANRALREIDSTIKARGDFLAQMSPDQRGGYASQKSELIKERNAMQESVNQLNRIESRTSAGM